MSKHHDRRKGTHTTKDVRDVETSKAKPEPLLQNEGEGSRTAARAYNDDLRSFIDEKRVEPAAKEAKDFVEQHPTEAKAAEVRAEAGPTPIKHRLSELASEGRAMFQRAQERVRGMIRRRLHRGG
ncbi:MAG: hypothetical protein KF773_17955 [Deltaproteobacteria bacterium]|nr:hypothetical protein [Deltaproteobacteria bacterium]